MTDPERSKLWAEFIMEQYDRLPPHLRRALAAGEAENINQTIRHMALMKVNMMLTDRH